MSGQDFGVMLFSRQFLVCMAVIATIPHMTKLEDAWDLSRPFVHRDAQEYSRHA